MHIFTIFFYHFYKIYIHICISLSQMIFNQMSISFSFLFVFANWYFCYFYLKNFLVNSSLNYSSIILTIFNRFYLLWRFSFVSFKFIREDIIRASRLRKLVNVINNRSTVRTYTQEALKQKTDCRWPSGVGKSFARWRRKRLARRFVPRCELSFVSYRIVAYPRSLPPVPSWSLAQKLFPCAITGPPPPPPSPCLPLPLPRQGCKRGASFARCFVFWSRNVSFYAASNSKKCEGTLSPRKSFHYRCQNITFHVQRKKSFVSPICIRACLLLALSAGYLIYIGYIFA